MAPSISATLVSADVVQATQITIRDVPAGVSMVIEGTTADGSSWAVPGGEVVSTGEQVVLVDNRSALNIPVVYRLSAAGVVYSSDPLTVQYAGGQGVIQSLNGQTTAEFVWRDNNLPLDPSIYSKAFEVPGRQRPPVRIAPGGDGSGSLSIRTDRSGSEHLRELLRAGGPVVVRTDGQARDFPAVEIVLITSAPSELWPAVTRTGMSTDRVWTLGYLLVDDPEPGTPLSAFTWDDHDAAMAARTWDDWDALFSAMTWDDWDTIDWDQYQ